MYVCIHNSHQVSLKVLYIITILSHQLLGCILDIGGHLSALCAWLLQYGPGKCMASVAMGGCVASWKGRLG